MKLSEFFNLSLLVSTCVVAAALSTQARAEFRDVQFKSVDFENAVIELHNFGDTAEPFTNWRFCSHDDNQVRRYSSVGALDSITLDAGESVFFYFNNDAPSGADDAFNISGLGNFATALDQDVYSINLYINSGFSTPAAMVDHLQWNIGGADDPSAAVRSTTAVNGGLWTDAAEWISTSATTLRLELDLDEFGAPPASTHGPASYLVVEPTPLSPADLDGDEDVDGGDLAIWAADYGVGGGGDIDEDGDSDGSDYLVWQLERTGSGTLAAATAVPEPSSLVLAVALLLWKSRGRITL